MRGRDFAALINLHKERLVEFFSEAQVQEIEDNHQYLCRAYQAEPVLKALLDSHDDETEFKESWLTLHERFSMIASFAGGLASVFPNTSTAESDFSVLKWEKHDFRQSLSDLSLEGIIQAKQYSKLEYI